MYFALPCFTLTCKNEGNDKVSMDYFCDISLFSRDSKIQSIQIRTSIFTMSRIPCRSNCSQTREPIYSLYSSHDSKRRTCRSRQFGRFSQAERQHDLSISEDRGPRRVRKLIGSPVSAPLWQMRIVRDVFSGRKWFDGGCLS